LVLVVAVFLNGAVCIEELLVVVVVVGDEWPPSVEMKFSCL
jgi:hypothetical protein